jgi:membrane fusion protein, multidrug efflux system
VTPSDRVSRRDFLRRASPPRVVELSCERLYMKYADARSEGRVPEFLDRLAHDLEGTDEIRLTSREWLAREDFRSDVGPLLQARRALAALALAATIAATGCSSAAGKPAANGGEALPVNVVRIEPLELRREVEAVGTLAARDETVVSAEVEARVARLAADMGDRVAANAPLVILDGEKLRYRVDEQRAVLEQTRARLGASGTDLPTAEQTPDVVSALAQRTEAEQRLARAKQLSEKNLLPAQEFERAQTELETAKAAHQTALAASRNLLAEVRAREAALNSANRDLQDTVIRAPFDGVVAERLVSPGQFVRVQTPVMRIVRLHPLRLTAEIPERFGPAIRVGHTVTLRVDAYPDRPVEGRVTRISPDVNLKSRAFSIEGEVPNEDGQLKPGTFARVRIVTDRVDKIVAVPVTAVQTRYGRSVVFIVNDGKIAGSEVKMGDRLGANVEILEGVNPGATIVADGVEGLSDGLHVTPRTAAPAGERR